MWGRASREHCSDTRLQRTRTDDMEFFTGVPRVCATPRRRPSRAAPQPAQSSGTPSAPPPRAVAAPTRMRVASRVLIAISVASALCTWTVLGAPGVSIDAARQQQQQCVSLTAAQAVSVLAAWTTRMNAFASVTCTQGGAGTGGVARARPRHHSPPTADEHHHHPRRHRSPTHQRHRRRQRRIQACRRRGPARNERHRARCHDVAPPKHHPARASRQPRKAGCATAASGRARA